MHTVDDFLVFKATDIYWLIIMEWNGIMERRSVKESFKRWCCLCFALNAEVSWSDGRQGLLRQREQDELRHKGMELVPLFREEQEAQSLWNCQMPGCGKVVL